MGEKVRIVYLAYSDLIPYSDPTEPRLYPNKYCPLVEKEHYDEQARQIAILESRASQFESTLAETMRVRDEKIKRLKALVLEAKRLLWTAGADHTDDWLERASKELGE